MSTDVLRRIRVFFTNVARLSRGLSNDVFTVFESAEMNVKHWDTARFASSYNIIAYYLFNRFVRIASGGIVNCKFVKLNFAARCRLQISVIARPGCAVRLFPALSVIKKGENRVKWKIWRKWQSWNMKAAWAALFFPPNRRLSAALWALFDFRACIVHHGAPETKRYL